MNEALESEALRRAERDLKELNPKELQRQIELMSDERKLAICESFRDGGYIGFTMKVVFVNHLLEHWINELTILGWTGNAEEGLWDMRLAES